MVQMIDIEVRPNVEKRQILCFVCILLPFIDCILADTLICFLGLLPLVACFVCTKFHNVASMLLCVVALCRLNSDVSHIWFYMHQQRLFANRQNEYRNGTLHHTSDREASDITKIRCRTRIPNFGNYYNYYVPG